LGKILRPAGPVLEIDVELIKIRRAAVHDDEPRIVLRFRIEAGEPKRADVPIEIVAAEAFDDPIGLIAKLLGWNFRNVPWIERAAGRLIGKSRYRSTTVGKIKAGTE